MATIRCLPLPVALAAGLVFALGQPPFDLWWLALPALICPFVLMQDLSGSRQSFWLGWCFGFGYFFLSLFWITEPFLVDAARHGWMAPFAVFLMAGGLALFWGGAFALTATMRVGALGLIALWTLTEVLRSLVFTGFPWGLIGYSLAPVPLVQWAAIVGSFGLTAMALALAAIASRSRLGVLSALLIAAGLWVGGVIIQPKAQDLTGRPVVRVVQPNVPQDKKWDPEYRRLFFDRLLALSAAEPAPDVTLWPETALTVLLHQADPFLEAMSAVSPGGDLIFGVQRLVDDQFYNSAVQMDAEGHLTASYDKHHLVPFGEYMPLTGLFDQLGFSGLVGLPAGFSAGGGPQVIKTAAGVALPLICYEAVFARDLRGTVRPDYVVHLTNDGWFGTGAGPAQHLMQARLRAIEFGLPVVRSANTGISAMIDPAGRILERLPIAAEGYLDAALPRAVSPTFYARVADWPVIIFCLMTLGLAGIRRRLAR